MSEMVQNRGIVKEIYMDEPNIAAKLAKLANDLDVSVDDIVYPLDEGDTSYEFKDRNGDNFHIYGDRLFDISGAPDEYDADDEREHMVKTAPDTYEVDFYYYNGGTYFGEMFNEALREAEEAFEDQPKSEDMDLFEDAFGEWLEEHGVKSLHPIGDEQLFEAKIDLNELKAGITDLLAEARN